MKRIGLEAQTIFAQIVESVWSDPVVYGSFSRKTVKGKTFLYQEYTVEGKQVQTYLGEATDSLVARMEEWKEHNRALQRLAAMATQGGCLAVDRLTEAVAMRFAECGWFRAGGVLVGSHAFAVIGNVLGAAWSGEAIRTRDVDLATPKRIAIAARPDIGAVIAEMGYTPIPSLNRKIPPSSYALRGRQAKIDIVTPEIGKASVGPTVFPSLGIAAQPLRFLDYLLEDSVETALLGSTAVAVRVPHPARFAFHKLIVAERRHIGERTKGVKDIAQAEAIFGILLEDRPGDIPLAWEAIVRRRWKKQAQPGLGRVNDAMRKAIVGLR